MKLPTILTVGKAEVGRVREEKKRSEKIREERRCRRSGRKVAIHCVFPMICGSGGSKSRLAKAAGAEAAGQMRDEKLHTIVEVVMSKKAHAIVARSTLPSQNVQNNTKHHARTTFGSCHVEKVHAVVTRSTFPSQNLQNTKGFGPLFDVQMSKKVHAVVARRCAKHVSKSKCTKN